VRVHVEGGSSSGDVGCAARRCSYWRVAGLLQTFKPLNSLNNFV
jgi:hypothetical protein